MRNTKAALTWIVSILKELGVQFEIDGGLAAEMYGSKRELADIDINVSAADFDRVVSHVKEYIIFGPDWYKDENWNVYMITLKYAGQLIDIGSLGKIHFYDKVAGEWREYSGDLSESRTMNYLGIDLPFVNEIKLMAYKEEISRGVDRKDVGAMVGQLKKEWQQGS